MTKRVLKRIDMYAKSARKGATHLCPLYAKRRAEQWLGPGAYHQCDEACAHDWACQHCLYGAWDEKMQRFGCMVEEEMHYQSSFSAAYRAATKIGKADLFVLTVPLEINELGVEMAAMTHSESIVVDNLDALAEAIETLSQQGRLPTTPIYTGQSVEIESVTVNRSNYTVLIRYRIMEEVD